MRWPFALAAALLAIMALAFAATTSPQVIAGRPWSGFVPDPDTFDWSADNRPGYRFQGPEPATDRLFYYIRRSQMLGDESRVQRLLLRSLIAARRWPQGPAPDEFWAATMRYFRALPGDDLNTVQTLMLTELTRRGLVTLDHAPNRSVERLRAYFDADAFETHSWFERTLGDREDWAEWLDYQLGGLGRAIAPPDGYDDWGHYVATMMARLAGGDAEIALHAQQLGAALRGTDAEWQRYVREELARLGPDRSDEAIAFRELAVAAGADESWSDHLARLEGVYVDPYPDVDPLLERGLARDLFDEARALHARGDLVAAIQKYRESSEAWGSWGLAEYVDDLERVQAGETPSRSHGFEVDVYRPCGIVALGSVSVPADFRVITGSGPAHAGWGGSSSLEITAAGEVLARQEISPYPDQQFEERRWSVGQEAVRRIYAEVLACEFFDLEEGYRNSQIMDGGVSYLTVTADGRTHSVYMSNISVARAASIIGMVETKAGAARIAR